MYNKAKLEIVEFAIEDVITTSGAADAGSGAADAGAGAGAGYTPNNPNTLPWDEEYD